MKSIQKSVSELGKWVEGDKENRAVIVIAAKITNREKESFNLDTLVSYCGQGETIVSSLEDALSDDKNFRQLTLNAIERTAVSQIIKIVSE